MKQNITLSTQIENSAIKAVYELQYNLTRASRFVMSEVPNTSQELAILAINLVSRVSKEIKK